PEFRCVLLRSFLDFIRLADIPYKHDIYNSIEKKPDYLKRVRLSYTNYRFKDSDPMVEQKSEIQVKTGNLKELTPEQMEECAVFWGRSEERRVGKECTWRWIQ